MRSILVLLTYQPKNRLKGRNGHGRNTPHGAEKGNGNRSLPFCLHGDRSRFAGGRGKTGRKHHHTLGLFSSSSLNICCCCRQDTGPDGARRYRVRPFSRGLSAPACDGGIPCGTSAQLLRARGMRTRTHPPLNMDRDLLRPSGSGWKNSTTQVSSQGNPQGHWGRKPV